jgi:hypothetical protein
MGRGSQRHGEIRGKFVRLPGLGSRMLVALAIRRSGDAFEREGRPQGASEFLRSSTALSLPGPKMTIRCAPRFVCFWAQMRSSAMSVLAPLLRGQRT